MDCNSRKRHADAHECLTHCPSKAARLRAPAVTPAAPESRRVECLATPANQADHLRSPLRPVSRDTSARTGDESTSKQQYTPYTPDLNARLPQSLLSLHKPPKEPAAIRAPLPSLYKPIVLHPPHPDSKLCQNFHWVPYPLGLMSYDSWYRLHHRDDIIPFLPYRCPVCRQDRKVTAHTRKAFLVAERLSWDEKLVAMPDRDLNEELNWKVNYELGIVDPFVEDSERIPGGKHSRHNRFYPYQNEHEMKLAMKLIFMTEDITETTWALWIGTQLDLQRMVDDDGKANLQSKALASTSVHKPTRETLDVITRHHTPEPIATIGLTESPEPLSKRPNTKLPGLPTPQSSLPKFGHVSTMSSRVNLNTVRQQDGLAPSGLGARSVAEPAPCSPTVNRCIKSYTSLQDFYSLLDRIERTSYVGAVFLEAYAEKLRDDMCRSCWLKHNIDFVHF